MRSLLDSLIYPIFVKTGKGAREAIPSMPGVFRFSPDVLVKEIKELKESGINRILLFGLPEKKDDYGSGAYKDGNITAQAVSLLKRQLPGIVIMTDVCLCAYTSCGHCGILKRETGREIDNAATLEVLAKIAVSHAQAGADYVAPSAMAKGQVRAIRDALDNSGYRNTKIMGYSAKFASQFYGPFREAADSRPKSGDRRNYQLDCKDSRRALAEIEDDIKEGADIVMVKPALGYLDIIRQARDRFSHTIAAYNVSGEYAMVKGLSRLGYCDEKEMVFEIMTAIRRAGSDIIITYHARDIAKWLKEEKAKSEKNQEI